MQQLFNINALLPKDQWLPDEPMIHEVKFDDMDSDVRLPKVSFGKEDEYVEDGSVSIYDDNNDSAFFDTDAAAELASNVAAPVAGAMTMMTRRKRDLSSTVNTFRLWDLRIQTLNRNSNLQG